MNSGHEQRIAAGVGFAWQELPPLVETLGGIAQDVEDLHFRRQKSSHRGLGRFAKLKRLWLHKADQNAIDEIARLQNLGMLFVRGLTATSLLPLGQNRSLKRLILIGGSKVRDLDWAATLPPTLEVLFLEGFTKVSDLGALGTLSNLTVLGFEGGMDMPVRIDSLEPLAQLNRLRHLFLAASRVATKSLAPLRPLPRLELLECTIHFPDSEFIALHESLPGLRCDWITMITEHGSLRAGQAAMMARIRGEPSPSRSPRPGPGRSG